MEHKLNESEKWWLLQRNVSVAANFRIKRYGADYARDKMFKEFSRPQIDLEDIMKFDKVAAYVAENDLDQEILEQAERQVFWFTSKRKK
jgi:tRNA uridine 5-carboxymethylaminomethyl modification enzyme